MPTLAEILAARKSKQTGSETGNGADTENTLKNTLDKLEVPRVSPAVKVAIPGFIDNVDNVEIAPDPKSEINTHAPIEEIFNDIENKEFKEPETLTGTNFKQGIIPKKGIQLNLKRGATVPPQKDTNVKVVPTPPTLEPAFVSPGIDDINPSPGKSKSELTHESMPDAYTQEQLEELTNSLHLLADSLEDKELVSQVMINTLLKIRKNPALADMMHKDDFGLMAKALRSSYKFQASNVTAKDVKKRQKAVRKEGFMDAFKKGKPGMQG